MPDLLHPGGHDRPLLSDDAIQGADLDAALGHEPHAILPARRDLESLLTHGRPERLRVVGGSPGGLHDLPGFRKVDSLTLERLALRRRRRRAGLLGVLAVGSDKPRGNVLAAVLAHPAHS